MNRVEAAAQYLVRAHETHANYQNLPSDLAPIDLRDAYKIQQVFHKHLEARYGSVVGWKIAVTTPAMRKILDIPRPVIGAIFRDRVHRAPVRLSAADFVRPCIEFEIALELSRDLPRQAVPYRAEDMLPLVTAAYPAFELVDDRFADYRDTQGTSLCADNAWNAGIVLGPRVEHVDESFLKEAQGQVTFEGRDLGMGTSSPLESLAWLANELADIGLEARKGMIIMTGSLVATQYPAAGSRAEFTVKGLGEVTVEFV